MAVTPPFNPLLMAHGLSSPASFCRMSWGELEVNAKSFRVHALATGPDQRRVVLRTLPRAGSWIELEVDRSRASAVTRWTAYGPPKYRLIEFLIEYGTGDQRNLPVKWTMRRYDSTDGVTMTRNWRLTVASFESDAAVDDRSCRVDLPTGTIVVNLKTRRSYAVNADGTPGKDYRTIKREMELKQVQRQRGRSSWRWLTAFVLGAIVTIVAVRMWIVKNR